RRKRCLPDRARDRGCRELSEECALRTKRPRVVLPNQLIPSRKDALHEPRGPRLHGLAERREIRLAIIPRRVRLAAVGNRLAAGVRAHEDEREAAVDGRGKLLDSDQTFEARVDAALFPRFPQSRRGRRLPGLDTPPRHRPLPLKRMPARLPDQQDGFVPAHDGADEYVYAHRLSRSCSSRLTRSVTLPTSAPRFGAPETACRLR